jgi:hypothetical protein
MTMTLSDPSLVKNDVSKLSPFDNSDPSSSSGTSSRANSSFPVTTSTRRPASSVR